MTNLNLNLISPDIAKEILREIKRRKTSTDITDHDFPKQAAFVTDRSRLLAGFCTRRAGKSFGIGLKLYNACLQHPGVSNVYIALTRDSAKRIMFKDVFKAINRKYDLGANFNHTELSITLPNQSIIYCLGMDSSPDEMDKVLGQKFKLAVIDEAGSFRQDLREIVYSRLRAAVSDLDGQIVMIGTPQNFTKGLFYDVVWAKTEPGWKVHTWSAFDNPYMVKQWERDIKEMTDANPRVVETPWFKQNFLGQYVVDQSALCYRYSNDRNRVPARDVPDTPNTVLGIDLGFTDATAFSLLGYRGDAKKLYVLHTSKEKELTLTQVAERIQWYINRYKPYKLIIDNAAKQAVEELKQRFLLPLTPADKTGKADFIEIMNSDFIAGNIVVSDACTDLIDEYSNLIWDDKSKKKQEHPNCENHLADATLYAWRYCYQYISELPKAVPTEEERVQRWEEEILEPKGEKEWWEKI